MNIFGEIFAYALSVTFIGLTVHFTSKRHFRLAGAFGFFGFVSFIFAQFHGNNIPITFWNLSAEQLLCWCFALLFFGVAIYFVHEKALPYAFALSLISVFCCFCGFSSVQALLKTHMLWVVTDTLKSYGDKIDNFQNTIADMNQRLAAKQAELETNQLKFVAEINRQKEELKAVQVRIHESETNIVNQQSDITNQFLKISIVQSGLEAAQTNLTAQELKLSDVEYWVQNLYANMTTERLTLSDTNHILLRLV